MVSSVIINLLACVFLCVGIMPKNKNQFRPSHWAFLTAFVLFAISGALNFIAIILKN